MEQYALQYISQQSPYFVLLAVLGWAFWKVIQKTYEDHKASIQELQVHHENVVNHINSAHEKTIEQMLYNFKVNIDAITERVADDMKDLRTEHHDMREDVRGMRNDLYDCKEFLRPNKQ